MGEGFGLLPYTHQGNIMGVVLYKEGNTHEEFGIKCEIGIFPVDMMESLLAVGWKTHPKFISEDKKPKIQSVPKIKDKPKEMSAYEEGQKEEVVQEYGINKRLDNLEKKIEDAEELMDEEEKAEYDKNVQEKSFYQRIVDFAKEEKEKEEKIFSKVENNYTIKDSKEEILEKEAEVKEEVKKKTKRRGRPKGSKNRKYRKK